MNIGEIKNTYNHSLNSKRKLQSVVNYFKLGIYMRLNKNKMFQHNYLQGIKLMVGKKSSSSVVQYFNGLNDFEEMSLLIHFLDEGDTFLDVGANVGVFSILASGVAKAKSIAIEPNVENIEIFNENIKINNLHNQIKIIRCVVGDEIGETSFTKGLDCINRITRNEDLELDSELIKMETLDHLLTNDIPNFIKIDVEGFEVNVLKGAKKILSHPDLKILILETNGLSNKYNLDESEIFTIMEKQGFNLYSYEPFERELRKKEISERGDNSIFIREKNIDKIALKIKKSKNININKLSY